CLCFFFQAEDGIRDSSVTGVQTCALPICDGGVPGRWFGAELDGGGGAGVAAGGVGGVGRTGAAAGGGAGGVAGRAGSGGEAGGRSEERRVGKECRCRWTRGQSKKRDRSGT